MKLKSKLIKVCIQLLNNFIVEIIDFTEENIDLNILQLEEQLQKQHKLKKQLR